MNYFKAQVFYFTDCSNNIPKDLTTSDKDLNLKPLSLSTMK